MFVSFPKAQYLSNKKNIDKAIKRVLISGNYILNKEVKNFENEFSIWDKEDKISRKYLKPNNVLDLFETYNLYKNNRIKT